MRLVAVRRRRLAAHACLTGLLLAAAGLVGCDRSDLETRNCIKTRLIAQGIDTARPSDLRLAATLETQAGEPVPDRRVDFGVARDPERIDQFFTGSTDAAGRATADVAGLARDFPQVDKAVRNATMLVVSYRNPDAFNDAAQPNYCSTKTTVGFRYTGPFDYSQDPA